VVTGPTKELLQLKELEAIHSPALGEIRLWNWFDRSLPKPSFYKPIQCFDRLPCFAKYPIPFSLKD
jgi:hypothetical protein